LIPRLAGASGGPRDAKVAVAAATALLADELGSAADRRAIVGLLDRLSAAPATFVRSFGYECRLDRDDQRIDFAITVDPAPERRAVLRDACSDAPGGPSGTAATPSSADRWRGVREFAHRWSDGASAIGQGVSLAFLEFDSPFVDGEAPAVFARLDPSAASTRSADDSWNLWGPLVREVIETVTGAPLAAEVEQRLMHAVLSLPAGAHIADCATFTSRADGAVRLFLLVPSDRVAAYLGAIGWRGSVAQVNALVARHCAGLARVPLHVDLSDRVLPRIGIELGPDDPAAASSARGAIRGNMDPSVGWQRTLDRLVAAGCCDPGKREATLRWPGRTAIRSGGRWPAALHRRISHVKLVIDPEGHVRAKVYLWAICAFALCA
jgi:hypothetical protein